MKLSIVAEGGAMRGAYAVGVIESLISHFGLKHVDVLTGSSASIITLTYYAAGQFHHGYPICTEEATNPRFLSLWNLLRSRPILDIDYMVDEVLKKKVPLDINKLKNSKMRVIVPLTNTRTGKPHYIDNWSEEDFFDVMRASMAAPLIYGKSIKINGQEYFDGSFSDALPINHPSIKDSKKIILLTSPEQNSTKANTDIFFLWALKRKLGKDVHEALKENTTIYYEKIKRLSELEAQGDIVIRPSTKMSKFNNSIAATKENVLRGYNDAISNRKIMQLINDLKASPNGKRYFQ